MIGGSPKVITIGHILMPHVVNKALTHQLAANMISGHVVHAGKHRREYCRAPPWQELGFKSGGGGCYYAGDENRTRVRVGVSKRALNSEPGGLPKT